MTGQERATIAAAERILKASQVWIGAEPPECLLEILEQTIADLRPIKELGVLWRIINLEILLEKTQKRLEPKQEMLL